VASKTNKSNGRSKRELELLPVKSIDADKRTPKQKIERKLLTALYKSRTAKDAKARESAKKRAAELEVALKQVGRQPSKATAKTNGGAKKATTKTTAKPKRTTRAKAGS
jgi:hypothetical protein